MIASARMAPTEDARVGETATGALTTEGAEVAEAAEESAEEDTEERAAAHAKQLEARVAALLA